MTFDRTMYLGGTDVAAVCGRSEWKTRMDVYLRKTGQQQDHPASEAMLWGQLIEPLILDWWESTTGGSANERQVWARDSQEPWRGGSADAVGILPSGEKVLLEAKKIAQSSRSAWNKSVPIDYQYQVQHYMDLLGLNRAIMCVLFGGSEFATFEVPRDQGIQQEIRRECKRFWMENVCAKVPPSPLAHQLENAGPSVAIDEQDAAVEALRSLVHLRDLAKTVDEQIEIQQAVLEKVSKGVAALTYAGVEVASWRKVTRQATTIEGKSWMQFAIKPQVSLKKLLG